MPYELSDGVGIMGDGTRKSPGDGLTSRGTDRPARRSVMSKPITSDPAPVKWSIPGQRGEHDFGPHWQEPFPPPLHDSLTAKGLAQSQPTLWRALNCTWTLEFGCSIECSRLRFCHSIWPFYVYQLMGKNGECLYVGQTKYLTIRLDQHSKDKHWYQEVRYVHAHGRASRKDALRLETSTIHCFRRFELHNSIIPRLG